MRACASACLSAAVCTSIKPAVCSTGCSSSIGSGAGCTTGNAIIVGEVTSGGTRTAVMWLTTTESAGASSADRYREVGSCVEPSGS